jgi:glycerol-3-phosphate acyltransferase PlsY
MVKFIKKYHSLIMIILVLSFLLGSIPFGFLLMKMSTKTDVRTIGSGNIGATNVMRSGHSSLAVITLLCDSVKGSIAVLLGTDDMTVYCGILSILGHIFSPWLKGKGGKGIATALGVYFAFSWKVAVLCLITWGVFFKIFKKSSISGLLSMAFAPVWAFLFLGESIYISAMVGIFWLCLWTHRDNLRRLIHKKELDIS